MKNDLESSIREYYSEISPSPDEQRIEQTIRQARAIMRKVEYTDLADPVCNFAFLCLFARRKAGSRKRNRRDVYANTADFLDLDAGAIPSFSL